MSLHPYLSHHVSALYTLASAPLDDPPGVGILAVSLLGRHVFDVPTGPMPAGRVAMLVQHDGGYRIRAFEAAPRDMLIESIAMALAKWYAQHFAPDDRHLYGPDFAARIMLPTAALERHGAAFGFDAGLIAERFAVPERVAAIRIREHQTPDRSGSMRRLEVAV